MYNQPAKMMSIVISTICFVFITMILINPVSSVERKIALQKFSCNNTTDTHNDTLVIVEAIGPEDKVLYLWDFGSKPTFMIAHVSLNATTSLNCNLFANYSANSIKITPEPSYIFGAVFNKLYEFNDVDDTAFIPTNSSALKVYSSENYKWTIETSSFNESVPRIVVSGMANVLNGTIGLNVCAYTNDGKGMFPPHLFHSSNSSQIDVTLDNLMSSYNSSRFAVEFLLFSTNPHQVFNFSEIKTGDDENTPGVFKLDTIQFGNINETKNNVATKKGFIQWRPIVYTSFEKVTTSSTKAQHYSTSDINITALNPSLVNTLLNENNLFVKAQNFSFGSSTDKFYMRTNYSIWSFVIGIEDVPLMPYSFMALAIIIFSIGIPVLIVSGGVSFIILQHLKKINILSTCITRQGEDDEILVNDENQH